MRALMSLAIALAILAIACNGDDTESASSEDPPVAVATPEPEPTPEQAEPDPTPEPELDPTPEPPDPTPEPEPEPTPEPEPDPTPEPAQDTVQAAGTRGDPIPLGETARVGDWEIQVTEVIPEAWGVVPGIDIINDPPEAGYQYFTVELQATYVGEGSSQFWLDFELSAEDEHDVAYDNYEDTCGIIPDALDLIGQASTGGSVTGNVCWAVQNESAETLTLIVENWLSLPAERVYFALQ